MTISIVGLIYKSKSYLDMMMYGIRSYCLNVPNVDYLIVANDPVPDIETKLIEDKINHVIYHDQRPGDYYLNRVYRAWNFAGNIAKGDIVVFINSDMGFSPGWLESLVARLNEHTIPCSRLVESGKLESGTHAVGHQDFGKTAQSYNEQAFLSFAKSISSPSVKPGGLFMPCAFYKKDFIRSGGYPEGNIYKGGAGAYGTQFLQSGDDFFFYQNLTMRQKKHITVFDSVVYHIQEGEKDE